RIRGAGSYRIRVKLSGDQRYFTHPNDVLV
ncbi:MAG: hypothetical protein QOK19_2224, partial [Solirubrobacteraceae bacterium]|nr:hypothetical protein [Solirubrobacteraceae bacterium]